MTPADFLVHAFVWSLILAGLLMGIGYAIEVWKQFVTDWKYAAELRRASQRRGNGSMQPPQVSSPRHASPLPRHSLYDQDSPDA